MPDAQGGRGAGGRGSLCKGSPPPTGQDGNTATEPREGCEPRACGECSSLALAGSSGLEAAGGTLECRL